MWAVNENERISSMVLVSFCRMFLSQVGDFSTFFSSSFWHSVSSSSVKVYEKYNQHKNIYALFISPVFQPLPLPLVPCWCVSPSTCMDFPNKTRPNWAEKRQSPCRNWWLCNSLSCSCCSSSFKKSLLWRCQQQQTQLHGGNPELEYSEYFIFYFFKFLCLFIFN